jgi:hypothetical protein
VEFEGGGHTDPVEVLRDAGRYTRLVDRSWRIYRYTRFDVYGDPGRNSHRTDPRPRPPVTPDSASQARCCCSINEKQQ